MLAQMSGKLNQSENSRTPSASRFTFGRSPYWFASHNTPKGENRAPLKWSKRRGEMSNKYAESLFTGFTGTIRQLVADVIDEGRAITPGIFTNNWRKTENFIQAYLIAVDCDENVSVSELAAIPFVQQYGLFIHATKRSTPESPRSRVYFLTDEPIRSASDYQRFALRAAHQVSEQLGKKVDEQCSDAARRFLGCANAEYQLYPEKTVTMVTLEALPPAPKELEEAENARQRAESRQTAPAAGADAGHAQRLAYREINRTADILARTGKGNRNRVHCSTAFYAGTYVGAGAISEQDAFNIVYPAALAAGRPAQKAKETTLSGLKKGAAHPIEIKPKTRRPKRSKQAKARKELEKLLYALPSDATGTPLFTPYHPDAVTAQRTAHTQYLTPDHYLASDVAGRDLAVQSDMGTGKTHAAATAFADEESILSITYLIGLAEKLASDLNTESYKGLTAADLRQIDRLTITIQSLYKLMDAYGNVRKFKVVHIDEPEKVLAALGGGTFRKGYEAVRAYHVLKLILLNAERVICTDAHLTPVTQRFIEALRGKNNVLTCVNTFVREREMLIVHPSAADVSIEIEQLADADKGVVVVGTNSEKEAKRLERIFSERYGDESVFAIYGEVASELPRKTVIYNINQQITNYRVFIYSPSLASGIDIQTPVRAVCGIFNAEPLSAGECHQMMNRCRNAQEYHVYVQRAEGQRETSVETLLHNGLENARLTADAIEFEGEAYTSDQAGLHRLISMIDAQNNASKNHFFDHFMTLAQGYKQIRSAPERDQRAMREAREAATELLRAKDKESTLAASPTDDIAFNAFAENGQITPEIRAGFRRWKMEKAAGRSLTPELYDLIETNEARTALYTLRDVLHASDSDLKAWDRADHNAPISKRKHTTRRVHFMRNLLRTLFNGQRIDAESRFERAHIDDVMSNFLGILGDDLHRLFGRRSDKSENSVMLLRWFLDKMHLKLESVQLMENRQRRRVYRLNAEQLTLWQSLAADSWTRHQTDRAEREITQNRDSVVPHKPAIEESLESFDRKFEQALALAHDDLERQALIVDYIRNRPTLEQAWKSRGYAIPRMSRAARPPVQIGV